MLTSLSQWFDSLDGTMKILWGAAIAASVVFVIQNVLLLMGIGDMDSDVDADVSTDVDMDADGSVGQDGHAGTLGSAGIFSLFTLRNFINFFLGFGWGGISLAPIVQNKVLLVFLSIIAGLLFVAIFVVLLRFVLRLERNGSFRIADCVGETATVYLRIPGQHAEPGKIQISINGSVHELDAFTDGDFIPTGARVRVVKVIDGSSLLVEKL